MTGQWSFADEFGDFVSFSYPFQLATPIASADVEFLPVGEEETTDCPGTPDNPQAASGKLCIYTKAGPAEFSGFNELVGLPYSSVTGASLALEEQYGFGTWAVMAP
jgi:hypothetical protein